MAQQKYKLVHLPKHLGSKLDLDRIKELLAEIGWEDKESKGILAVVDADTYSLLVKKVNAESGALTVEPGVPTNGAGGRKAEAAPAALPTRKRLSNSAASLELSAATAVKPRKKREIPKTYFDKDDLSGRKKLEKADAELEKAQVIAEKVVVEKKPAAPEAPAKVQIRAEAVKERKADVAVKTPPAKKGAPEAEQKRRPKTEPKRMEERSKVEKPGKKKADAARRTVPRRPPAKKKIKEIGRQPDEAVTGRSRKRVFKVKGGSAQAQAAEKVIRALKITGEMTVRELSLKSGVKVGDIIGFLLKELDIFANINHVVSIDEIQLIAENFGIPTEVKQDEAPEDILDEYEKIEEGKQVPRPPVVTIMGHVDHGKTKLLDRIRHTNVVDGEAGGITQHIGAYQIVHDDRAITFLDTPGHAAFTQMRARGSQVTDIVVLVVAADDGVKPQTKEAAEHAKAANVPIIVALNKCDLPSANPDRTISQIAELGLTPEDWGGDTVFVKISALTGDNIDELLEMILLQADLLELKADPKAPAYGVVVESEITKGQGIIATALVIQGTFKPGQYLICGTSGGRIKRMEDEWGNLLKDALPSRPVRIIGLDELPGNGDKIFTFSKKRKATEIIESRIEKAKIELQRRQLAKPSLEDFLSRLEKGEIKNLNVIVKTDVGGSEEAIISELERIKIEGVQVNVVSHGVGQINENDIMLASASNAIIIGFSTSMTSGARKLADKERVDVQVYDIIYQMTEKIENAMKGLLDPIYEEIPLGRVEVREIFRTEKTSVICGGSVLDGKVVRNKQYRLIREEEVIHEGQLKSLRRFKEDVRDVASGFECGFIVEGTNNVQLGDILSVYEMKEVPRF